MGMEPGRQGAIVRESSVQINPQSAFWRMPGNSKPPHTSRWRVIVTISLLLVGVRGRTLLGYKFPIS
jgi:hypothetical protein